MQAQCSQCSSRIQIDDNKVPDKPFKVKCPKCQALITLPGRSAEVAPAAAPAASAYVAPPPPPSPAAAARRDRVAESSNDAIIAPPGGPAATALQAALVGLGYNVDAVDDIEEGARLVEQGLYEVAVTSRTPPDPGKPESLAQRLLRLSPDARRRVFVILVGEEFRTADGTQAWVTQADLVVHPNDAPRCDHLIRTTMLERKRLYSPLVDARRKIETD
ncbi:MAG: zinc-ribbon domain-containing protein [Vicinamibacterales bacterium]